jgi:Cu(I)/Ag(I) efflux system membrane protein CusA/SilA
MFIRWWLGFVLLYLALIRILESLLPGSAKGYLKGFETAVILALFTFLLATHWLPLGPEKGDTRNVLFVAVLIGAFLLAYEIFKKLYPYVLRWCLDHKALFLFLPFAVSLLGLVIWLGAHRLTAWLPKPLRSTAAVVGLNHAFPGLGKEFMPPLDEGSYLYMPTTMPHASIGEVQDILGKQDMAFSAIPEVETAVGKLGRAESPLDPAPISMIETVINYKPEYLLDRDGTRRLFKFRADKLDYFRAVKCSLLTVSLTWCKGNSFAMNRGPSSPTEMENLFVCGAPLWIRS